MQWTPELVFACAYVSGALGGLAVALDSGDTLTPRMVLGSMLKYGFAGSALGMFMYEIIPGGKHRPIMAVCSAGLVGIRIIHLNEIGNFFRRILGAPNDDKKP